MDSLRTKMKMPHYTTILCSMLLLASGVASRSAQCVPGVNCKLPNCRCSNDDSIPGGIPAKYTPQIILVTFENAVNEGNVGPYLDLFSGLKNPNGCPALGTFYVQEKWTDMGVVKRLFDMGHEIGVNSIDGTLPHTATEWLGNITEVRRAITQVAVPEKNILGVRAPELSPGGLAEFWAISVDHLLYDASCATGSLAHVDSLLWPYTYDFIPGVHCDIGESLDGTFPGLWQVLIADLEFKGQRCASPAACTNVVSQNDAFEIFYNSFINHYHGKRSPFMMVINPEWVTVPNKKEGTIQFLKYVTSLNDVWIVTVSQALDWVRYPVPSWRAKSGYAPWGCAH
ncbi:chitin deacetylase 8-like isoform X2 [Babylonia areolata]|uniref:chitin deacetylase 8-like isoform X2 n=1 Tax=Babylonia areolata TaxID=304850 RepID=UPI003FD4F7C3